MVAVRRLAAQLRAFALPDREPLHLVGPMRFRYLPSGMRYPFVWVCHAYGAPLVGFGRTHLEAMGAWMRANGLVRFRHQWVFARELTIFELWEAGRGCR
jgi:hypothetical protein